MNDVVLFHPYLIYRGGAERKILLFANYLNSIGLSVEIITLDFDRSKTFTELLNEKVSVRILSGNILIRIYQLLFIRCKRLYVSNYPANIFSILILSKCKIWICNELILERSLEMGWKVSIFKIIFDKFSANFFKKIVSNSKNTQKNIFRYYKKESIIIFPGLDVKALEDLIALSIPGIEGNFIFTISRISFDKNIRYLEEIISVLKYEKSDIKIVVAGTGPEDIYIKNLAASFPNLIYLGSVSERQKKWLFTHCKKFFFMPKDEPLGVTILEALYFGCSISAWNLGGPSETLATFPKYLHSTNDDFLQSLHNFSAYSKESQVHHIKKNFSVDHMNNRLLNA
jgi:glycosyltransferase involved in cell wall biosynthesis